MKFKKKKKVPFYKKSGFWGIFIITIMVFSTIGFMWEGSNNAGSYDYYGTKFRDVGYGWALNIQGKDFVFDNLPTELENINFSINTQIKNPKVYLADYPLENNVNKQYVMQKLGSFFIMLGVRPQPACMTEEGCGNVPIVNCNLDDTVIVLKEDNVTRVYSKDNCIYVTGKDTNEAIKASERLMYGLLGIM